MTATNEALKAKLEWEGWPDGLEWFSGEEFEDSRVGPIVDRALDHYIALESIRRELYEILDEDDSS